MLAFSRFRHFVILSSWGVGADLDPKGLGYCYGVGFESKATRSQYGHL